MGSKKRKLSQKSKFYENRGKLSNFAEIVGFINLMEIEEKCTMHHRLKGGMDAPGPSEFIGNQLAALLIIERRREM